MRLARNEGLTLGSILPRIDRLELICLALNIEASGFQDVGYEANPRPSLYLDDDVQGIGDIGLIARYGISTPH